MRKLICVLLAVCMVMSLSVPALAATMTPTVNKGTIQTGEDVVVTVNLDETIENVTTISYKLYFDSNVFSLKSGVSGSSIAGVVVSKVKTDAAGSYVHMTYLDPTSQGVTLQPGTYALVTFTAKQEVASEATASFRTEFYNGRDVQNNVLTHEAGDPISVTVTPAAPVVGYAVAMSQDISITYGENVQATISVANDTVESYNAYDVVVKYDNTVLEYQVPTTISGDEVAVTHDSTNHTIRITGYGNDKAFTTALATLNFSAKAVGVGAVTIQSAKVSNSAQAIEQDAPTAAVTDADTLVTVGGYPVTLPAGFTGDATVLPGADYTFTANDKNYDYTFTATVGGEHADVVDNGNGTFTIKSVNGEVNIEATATPKTFDVTVTGDGAADVTAEKNAAYLTDYTFTVAKDVAYAYTVKAQIGNGAAFDVTLENGTYKIPGADIIGNITITVTKTLAQTKVAFSGTGSGDVKNGTEQTAEPNKAFTFSITKAEHYTYTVKLGETVLTEENGVYTIPAASMNTAVVNVTVEKTADFDVTVEVKEYVKLDGQSIFLVTAIGTLGGEDKALAYGDSTMYWSEKYNAYAWLMISSESADAVKTAAAEAIQVASATATNVNYSCDVNGSTNVDINDAQLVYDMYNVKYVSFEPVTMLKFLNADVNGDGKLDVNDSAAIVNKILTP